MTGDNAKRNNSNNIGHATSNVSRARIYSFINQRYFTNDQMYIYRILMVLFAVCVCVRCMHRYVVLTVNESHVFFCCFTLYTPRMRFAWLMCSHSHSSFFPIKIIENILLRSPFYSFSFSRPLASPAVLFLSKRNREQTSEKRVHTK